jgi:energy-converting hydrogenase A subunit R
MAISDWEGPWVIADHAFEVAKKGIWNGEKLFSIISEYDDYLAYIRKKVGYEPGDTLALIAPFLIAYNVHSGFLLEVAKENANFIDGALEAIRVLEKIGHPIKIISTSYCQYVYYTTALAGIPKTNVRCTMFEIDKYIRKIIDEDKKFVREKVKQITGYPKLGISPTLSENQLNSTVREAIRELDCFFWDELPNTGFKEVLEEVKPLGGYRKYQALLDFSKDQNEDLSACVVIGDSITDWVMLKNVKEAGGLAISFNGNEYAVRNSNVALISDTCLITPIIIDLFMKKGLSAVKELTKNWTYENLRKAVRNQWINSFLFENLIKRVNRKTKVEFPLAVWIDEQNLEETVRKSMEMRKKVRGITVGSLG